MQPNPWLLLAPIAATAAFFVFTWLARSGGQFWTWPNFYLGPTLSTTSFAFLCLRLRERLQVLAAQCDADPTCAGGLDQLRYVREVLPNLTTLVFWVLVFYWQIVIYRRFLNHSTAWVKHLWLAGVSNILGLLAYVIYWQVLFGNTSDRNQAAC